MQNLLLRDDDTVNHTRLQAEPLTVLRDDDTVNHTHLQAEPLT